MLNFKGMVDELLTPIEAEAAANINGGDEMIDKTVEEGAVSFNRNRYLQALGVAYLAPPGIGEITNKEALLAQYEGWRN